MSRLLRISADLSLVLIATIAAIVLRTDLDLPSPDFIRYMPYLAATAIIAVLSIGALKLDVGFWRYASIRDILSVIAVAALTASTSTAAIFAVNRLGGIARTIPILQFVFIIVVLLAPRFIARCTAGASRRPAHFRQPLDGQDATKNVLIIGFNAMSALYVRSLAEAGARSFKVIGLVGLRRREAGRYVGQVPILGTAENLSGIVSELAVHGVALDRLVLAVAPSDLSVRARQELQAVAADYGLTIDVLAERVIGCSALDTGLGVAASASGSPSDERAGCSLASSFARSELATLAASRYWRAKRGLDIAGALILVAVLLPVGLLAAILTVIDVGVPLVFWQVRVGMGGASFRLFKLRTMSSAYDPHGVRIADSARTSSIGALLRRLRLDELPQLWNVLAGDMSLIGPRPLLAVDQPTFDSGRLFVRPGLTGWAQVCGGRDISSNSKAALDVWYVRNASFALDLRILVATLRMLLLGERIEPSKIDRARADLERASHSLNTGAFPSISTMATGS